MTEVLIIELPAMADRNRADTHWWRVADAAVIERGTGDEWTRMLVDQSGEPRRLVALAPASMVRVSFAESPPGATPRQAEAIARVAAIETSLGDAETLQVVSVIIGDDQRPIMTTVAENGALLGWIDWLRFFGADPDHIVPVATLLPASEEWLEARFGSESVVGRSGLVMPHDPALAEAVIGGAEVESLSEAQVEAILAAAATNPPIDLRTGRFARRKRLLFDRDRVRQLALLAAAIPIIALLWALVALVKINGATARLDSETLSMAETVLGRPTTLENAEAELRQRVGGAGYGGFQPSLAALYGGLRAEQGVASTELGYRPDGTLSATLAAPSVDPINRLLIALQRNGYRITAVPRQSPDGRSMVDITIRSGP